MPDDPIRGLAAAAAEPDYSESHMRVEHDSGVVTCTVESDDGGTFEIMLSPEAADRLALALVTSAVRARGGRI